MIAAPTIARRVPATLVGPHGLRSDRLRWLAFWAMIASYALFSSSTPEQFGAAELVIGVCLIALVGMRGLSSVGLARRQDTPFIHISRIGFIVLLGLPTLVSLVFGTRSLVDYGRDLTAFLFLFLYLLLDPYLREQPLRWLNALAHAVTAIGVAFSARYFVEAGGDLALIGQAVQYGDARYLPMDPAVTFAAIFALLQALAEVERGRFARALAWSAIAVFCIAPLAAMVVRAPLTLFIAVLLARSLIMPAGSPKRLVTKFGVLSAIAIAIHLALPLLDLVRTKYEDVGLATKMSEMASVGNLIAANPALMLVGLGWGSWLESPGYAGPVRFVHSFHAYMLLKAGMFGLAYAVVLTGAAFVGPAWQWLRAGLGRSSNAPMPSAVIGAGLATFSSSLFLQPTFKSLSFGLILALVLLASSQMAEGRHA